MSSFDLLTCDIEAFVAEATPQSGSLQEAASTQEILIQQIEGYLNRLKEAVCTDLQSIKDNCCNGGGASSFLALSDTPGSYAGEADKIPAVNAGETALEFIDAVGLPNLVAGTEVASGRQVLGSDSFFKLVDTGALPNSTVKFVAHGIGTPYRIISHYGSAKNPTSGDQRPLPFVSHSSPNNQVLIAVQTATIEVRTNANLSAWTSSHVILEYIKVA